MKHIMLTFGPHIVFGGYEDENQDVEAVLQREDTIIPPEKVSIIGKGHCMKTTADQVQHSESPNDIRHKELAFVSNDAHLNRILHILRRYPDHMPDGKKVNLFPIRTSKEGLDEFTLMEVAGLITYIYTFHRAAIEPYPYTIDHCYRSGREE
jgi:hypothetical protein